jgi:hypothetical protein
MPPGALQQWEPILRSQFAVALLLVAGLLVQAAVIRVLWRENKELNNALRELLTAQGNFDTTIRQIRRLMSLQRKRPDVSG